MDFARRPARGRLIRTLVLVSLLITSPLQSLGQASQPGWPVGNDRTTKVRELLEQSRWQEIVDELGPDSLTPLDLRYYYGSALAHLGRWGEARAVLLEGQRTAAQDKRFPVELAGIAFKQKRYPEAAAWLRRGLKIDPTDAYAKDFLGTVYFLQGNLEAALKYWNRIDKPQIASLRTDHSLQIRPALLDRALAFAPASTLFLPDLLTSRARVNGLGVFVAPNFELAAREDATFDVVLNLEERNGWGKDTLGTLLSTFRGIAYETVYPEYFNQGHSAINFASLLRWDKEKRRLAADLSGPWHQNPKWRYRLGVDFRNENWAIRSSFTGIAPVLASLNLRREAASADITSFNSGRWGWSAGMELSHRDYRDVDQGTGLTPGLLLEGTQLKQLSGIQYELWRVPDRRLIISTSASSQLGRIWSQPGQVFAKLQSSLAAGWFPQSQGEDYATHVEIRGGETAGRSPFD